jgi:hypothetical protein
MMPVGPAGEKMTSPNVIASYKQPGSLVEVIFDPTNFAGNIWFVNNSNSAATDSIGYGRTPNAPFASINFAANSANNTGLTATNGDVIYVLPGHVENIGNATVTCNVAGVRIIGVGTGTDRPLISFNNAAANIAITAASVTFRNFQTTTTVANVTKLFNVTGAYCILDGVDYVDTASSNPLSFLLTSSAANYVTVQNCDHYCTTAGTSAQTWIELVGMTRPRIRNNNINVTLDNAAGSHVIAVVTTAATDVEIYGNDIVQKGGTSQTEVIAMLTNTTGSIDNNNCHCNASHYTGLTTAASCYCTNNYSSVTVNKSGVLDPVVDTTS